MKISLTSVFVDDQAAAKRFYTEVLGFEVKHDMPMGEHSWLTVTSPEAADGPELLLEPAAHPAVAPYRDALKADGIPLAQFEVADLDAEHARLSGFGVEFTMAPMDIPGGRFAIFDDTCGNLISLLQPEAA